MSDYSDRLAAASAAKSAAIEALEKALRNVEPVTPENHTLFLSRPTAYAECLRKMADIVASLPALRAAVADATSRADALAELACYQCSGTGDYQAPTSHLTRGRPLCWKCGGDGRSAAARKAVAA